MNKKALIYGLVYSVFAIALKLAVLLGGYSFSHFGFNYLTLTCNLLLIPFYILVILHVRQTELGGIIGGREAARLALTVFAVGALVLSSYNYFEYKKMEKEGFFVEYYNGPMFLESMKREKTLKEVDYPKRINLMIEASKDAGFKATTGKLFGMVLIGISSALIVASILKKNKS